MMAKARTKEISVGAEKNLRSQGELGLLLRCYVGSPYLTKASWREFPYAWDTLDGVVRCFVHHSKFSLSFQDLFRHLYHLESSTPQFMEGSRRTFYLLLDIPLLLHDHQAAYPAQGQGVLQKYPSLSHRPRHHNVEPLPEFGALSHVLRSAVDHLNVRQTQYG